jgi:NADH:ubiquinone oxidoreductase subunit F (NADH-binding)
MLVGHSYDIRFTILMEKLCKKYGQAMFELEGIGEKHLDINRYSQDFFATSSATADKSIDGNANVNDKSVLSWEHESAKPIKKLNSLFLLWKMAVEKHSVKRANKMIEHEIRGSIRIHDLFLWNRAYSYYQETPIIIRVNSGAPLFITMKQLFDMYSEFIEVLSDSERIDLTKVSKEIYYKKQSGVTTKEEIALAYKMADLIDLDFSKLSDNNLRKFWVKNNPDKAREKIKKSELKGRGGAGFPTGMKWSTIIKALENKKANGEKNIKAYVVCNGSEGEPHVSKDDYILDNYPEEVVEGIKIAMKTIEAKEAYFVLNHSLFEKYAEELEKIIGKTKIKLFKKTGGYLCGEESTILETIEGKERKEPRDKPPYPTKKGLWGCPTLVNNVETFYSVALIAKDEYRRERFYTISGDVKNSGVFKLPEHWSVEKVLHKTENFPQEKFFVQVGGGASGQIFLDTELDQEACGMGAIVVHLFSKTDPKELMKEWIEFFYVENCGASFF